jgi:2,3-bisphosphoglycerate-dependent phosphoglycerate mutase
VSRDSGAMAGEATRIVAVRHGETVWNAEMRMQGQLDTALSDRGRRQAARAAEALAGEGIEAIVASDLARAFDTARAIATVVGLPIAAEAGLRERCFGIFEGYTYAEIDARWPEDAARWRRHETAFGPEGGETLIDFSARAVAAMTRIAAAARGRTTLVVTHGGVLDCLYRAASGLDLGAPRSWELGNAAINRLLYTGERFTLVGWGDTAHLEGGTLDDASEGDCPTVPRAAT